MAITVEWESLVLIGNLQWVSPPTVIHINRPRPIKSLITRYFCFFSLREFCCYIYPLKRTCMQVQYTSGYFVTYEPKLLKSPSQIGTMYWFYCLAQTIGKCQQLHVHVTKQNVNNDHIHFPLSFLLKITLQNKLWGEITTQKPTTLWNFTSPFREIRYNETS